MESRQKLNDCIEKINKFQRTEAGYLKDIEEHKQSIDHLEAHRARIWSGLQGNLDRACSEIGWNRKKLHEAEAAYAEFIKENQQFKVETIQVLVGSPFYLNYLLKWRVGDVDAFNEALLSDLQGEESHHARIDDEPMYYLRNSDLTNLRLTEASIEKLRQDIEQTGRKKTRLMCLIEAALNNKIAEHEVKQRGEVQPVFLSIIIADYRKFLSHQLGYGLEQMKQLLIPYKVLLTSFFANDFSLFESGKITMKILQGRYSLGVEAGKMSSYGGKLISSSPYQYSASMHLFLFRNTNVSVNIRVDDLFLLRRVLAFSVLGVKQDYFMSLAEPALDLMSYRDAFIQRMINSPCFVPDEKNPAELSFQAYGDILTPPVNDVSDRKPDAIITAAREGMKKGENYTAYNRRGFKDLYLKYLEKDPLIQSALRRTMVFGKSCLMLNVLMSHEHGNDLVETPHYIKARKMLRGVKVDELTLRALKARLDLPGVVSPRDAALYIALAPEGADHAEIIERHLHRVKMTNSSRKQLINALKLLSKDDFAQLKFRLNKFIASRPVVQADIQQLRKNKSEDADHLLLTLVTGRSKFKKEKNGNYYNALVSFLDQDNKFTEKKLRKFGLFKPVVGLAEDERPFDLEGGVPLKQIMRRGD